MAFTIGRIEAMTDGWEPRILKRAGLVYVSDREPGIRRERRGRGFCYRLPDGTRLCDAETKQRIRGLGIPPAYRNVWICAIDNGHLQATGFDERGRKQYRYHAGWQALRAEKKYDELSSFGAALPRIRRRARSDAEYLEDGERATLAALTLLLDDAHLRVGNAAYLETNGSYGATTLLKRHVSFGEVLELGFTAKGGRKVRHQLKAPRLQRILERIADLPGRKLFVWRDQAGVVHPVDSGRLNRYLSDAAGMPISAKTFRTWGGTVAAFSAAAEIVSRGERPRIKAMAMAAAQELANTPAVARESYIHPRVLLLAEDEKLAAKLVGVLGEARRPRDGLRASEERLLAFLDA